MDIQTALGIGMAGLSAYIILRYLWNRAQRPPRTISAPVVRDWRHIRR